MLTVIGRVGDSTGLVATMKSVFKKKKLNYLSLFIYILKEEEISVDYNTANDPFASMRL